jgi:adenylylsulfate kinase
VYLKLHFKREIKKISIDFFIRITSLSESGKSTLAHAALDKLKQLECRSVVLDGDNILHGPCKDLEFRNKDQKENIRLISEVAKIIVEVGIITITSFISPFKKDSYSARKELPQGSFKEIYCKASLEAREFIYVKEQYKYAHLEN